MSVITLLKKNTCNHTVSCFNQIFWSLRRVKLTNARKFESKRKSISRILREKNETFYIPTEWIWIMCPLFSWCQCWYVQASRFLNLQFARKCFTYFQCIRYSKMLIFIVFLIRTWKKLVQSFTQHLLEKWKKRNFNSNFHPKVWHRQVHI